ncbi:hypothetical protein K488DRAFT_87910 [Vararia minispora EC-137]|uniref:Uncharacterized protein n=1 Tax=Vararia minispora EC-137 TaxID=1314806 RepID=A0ACB8QF93_9AGAM|nr:hypothetical protein K488DRAFT_87910 [Vararia minispora EC-137]
MLVFIILMYLISAAHWILEAIFTVPRGSDVSGWIVKQSTVYVGASVALLTANVVLSDAIVLWRMCLLWKSNTSVLVLGVVLWLTTLGLSFVVVLGLHEL